MMKQEGTQGTEISEVATVAGVAKVKRPRKFRRDKKGKKILKKTPETQVIAGTESDKVPEVTRTPQVKQEVQRIQKPKCLVMYKSQLQEYAQKAAIPPPVYEFVKEGASHEPRFKAIVILNNVTYESPPGFPNLKSAEHAAAKAALDGLHQIPGGPGVAPSPVHESGLCKNLLQEYAQKNSFPLPVYHSQRSGEDHAPTFTSSVEIAGVRYSGGSAKNKKEAEIKAARTALLAIQSAAPALPTPEPVASTTPQVHVGLATLITSHLNSSSGKKRGRGAQTAVEERSPGRLKVDPQVLQASVDVHMKPVTSTPPEKIETAVNVVTPSKPEVQRQPNTSCPVTSSLDIAHLFATPGAKKILGLDSKPPQTETPSVPALSTPSLQTSVTQAVKGSVTNNGALGEAIPEMKMKEDVQVDLVNGGSRIKVAQ